MTKMGALLSVLLLALLLSGPILVRSSKLDSPSSEKSRLSQGNQRTASSAARGHHMRNLTAKTSNGAKETETTERSSDIPRGTVPSERTLIVKGETADPGKYRYFARLTYRENRRGVMLSLCGGVLISDRFVLTAATCVWDMRNGGSPGGVRRDAYGAAVGLVCDNEDNCGQPFVSLQAASYWVHPSWNTSRLVLDIALIRLSAAVPETVALPAEPDLGNVHRMLENGDTVELMSVGYGWINDAGAHPTALQELAVSFMPSADCEEIWGHLSNGVICVHTKDVEEGFFEGGLCSGDGGSPTIVPGTQASDVVVGVASFGYGLCSEKSRPDVLARASAAASYIVNVVCSPVLSDETPEWCFSTQLSFENPTLPLQSLQRGIHEDRDVPVDQFAWFAAIRATETDEYWCSGSWIGSRYVLTAAHCVERNLIVQIGYWCRYPDNCGRAAGWNPVDNVFFHRGQEGEPGGDLAILVLQNDVNQFVGKPAIPYVGPTKDPWTRGIEDGRKMTMVGAGRSAVSEDDVSIKAKKLKVKYLHRKQCMKRLSFPLEEFDICTKPQGGSPCPGDSGSALVVPGKGRWEGRDIILAVHRAGPRFLSSCLKVVEDRALVHVGLTNTSAIDFVQEKVCNGAHRAPDWCAEQELTPSPVPDSRATNPTPEPTTNAIGGDPAPMPQEGPIPSYPTPPPAKKLDVGLKYGVLHSFERHSGTVYSVSFNPDGTRLVSGGTGADGDLMNVWKPLDGGGATTVLMGFVGDVFSVQWNPSSDSVIAAGFGDGHVRLWRNVGATKEEVIDLGSGGMDMHNDTVRSIAWHPDGTTLVSGSYDRTIRIWNVEQREQVAVISAHSDRVRSVSFHSDGSQFASASDDKTIKLWSSSEPYNLLRTLGGHSKTVREVAYSPNGKFLASASLDGSARVWRVSNGRLIHEFSTSSKAWMLCVSWSPDSKFIVSGSADGLVRVWDAKNGGAALAVMEGHLTSVWSVDWSPDGIHIASGSTDKFVIVWKKETSTYF